MKTPRPSIRDVGNGLEFGMMVFSDMKNEIQIKFLADCPEFIPQISKWFFEEWGYIDPENSIEATSERLRLKLNKDKIPLLIVACKDQEILGVLELKNREMEEFPDYEHWLGGVYVAPRARGVGLASTMLNWAEQLANSLGVRQLYLQTEKHDGGLYARAGWLPLHSILSKGVEVLVMMKELDR